MAERKRGKENRSNDIWDKKGKRAVSSGWEATVDSKKMTEIDDRVQVEKEEEELHAVPTTSITSIAMSTTVKAKLIKEPSSN